MFPSPSPAASPAVTAFVQEYSSALRSAAGTNTALLSALDTPATLHKLTSALENHVRIFAASFPSAEATLESTPHRALALRFLAHALIRECGADAGRASKEYQWAALQADGLLDGDALEKADESLTEQATRIPIIYSPERDIVAAQAALESATGLPWRMHDDKNSEDRAGRSFEREYVCRVSNEGATRALLKSLRALTPESKSLSCCWITRKGKPGLAVVIDAELAENPDFQSALKGSDICSALKRDFQTKCFAQDYTKFQHQPSAELEIGGTGTAYEEIVCRCEAIYPEAMLSEDLADLTRTDCLEPQPHSTGGFALFYEHPESRDLALSFITRLVSATELPSTIEPWTDESFPYDRRYEAHLPLGLVRPPDFRELIRCNREVYEFFRAIAVQDRSLFLDLEDAIEDLQARELEKKVPVAESAAQDEALLFDTALTRDVRRHIHAVLVEGAYDERLIVEVVEELKPEALNRFLREHSLLYLLEHEEERLSTFDELIGRIRSALFRCDVRLSKDGGRATLVAFDDRFVAAADRYMDRLDLCASRSRG